MATLYENAGPSGPYAASIRKSAVPSRNWITLTDGWDIEHLYGRYCDTDPGRLAYFYNALTNVFGSVCNMGGLIIPLDTPQSPSGPRASAPTTGLRV